MDFFDIIGLVGFCIVPLIGISLIIGIGLVIFLIVRSVKKKSKKNRSKMDSVLQANNISISHRIDYKEFFSFIVDENNKKVVCCDYARDNYAVYNFSELIGCDFYQNKYTSNNKPMVDNLSLTIKTKDIKNPLFRFDILVNRPINIKSKAFLEVRHFAEQVSTTVEGIIANRN